MGTFVLTWLMKNPVAVGEIAPAMCAKTCNSPLRKPAYLKERKRAGNIPM
jgi:hypothetical protein